MLTIETESKVKEAILHPVAEVRWTALCFYTKSFTRDAGIMPLVIEAIQQYGRGNAGFRLLREAERLPQTEATVRWLVDELSQPWDLSNPADDNYCYAAAMVLCNAPPELLWPEIAELAAFPEELRALFQERFEMVGWDWETGWQALRDLVHDMQGWELELPQLHRAQRIIESLARHRDKAPTVLRQLEERCVREEPEISEVLEPFVVEVAGRMRLPEVAPILVERLHDDDLDMNDVCATALAHIGGDATVELIAREWSDGGEGFRMSAAEALEHIHTQRSVATCRELLEAEEDYEVTVFLANALLGHCVEEAINPVREILRDYDFGDEDANEIDLRDRLVAVATILGATFPEYHLWYENSVATNWGWGDFQEGRIRNRVRRQYGLEPIDDSDEDWEDELSPEEEREFASLWQRVRDIDPALFERMVNEELAESHEPEEYEEPLREEPLRRDPNQVGRNDPCPCGSGKKYKKCCLNKRQP